MKKNSYNLITENGVIILELKGFISAALIIRAEQELIREIAQLENKNKNVLIGIDASQVTGHNSASRLAGKHLLQNLKFDKCAIWTSNRTLATIAKYIIRVIRIRNPVKLFSSKSRAFAWLKQNIAHSNQADLRLSKGRGITLAIISSLLVFALVLFAYNLTLRSARQDRQNRLTDLAETAAERTERQIGEYVAVIRGFRSLFAASEKVTAGEFDAFYRSRGINQEFPGLLAFSYISRVEADREQDFLNKLNSDEFLKEINIEVDNIFPSQGQEVFYPVTFIEPRPDSPSSYGLDLGTTSRIANFLNAEKTGEVSVSETINLNDISGEEANPGFFITTPVYEEGVNLPIGFINAVFSYREIFTTTLDRSDMSSFSVGVFDDDELVYELNEKLRLNNSVEVPIDIENRSWRLIISGDIYSGNNSAESQAPQIVLLSGTLIAISVGLVVGLVTRTGRKAQELASYITEDLERESERLSDKSVQLEAMIKSIGEGLIVTDSKGVIVEINPTAEKFLGVKSEELIDRWYPDAVHLLDDKGRKVKSQDRPEIQTLLSGEPVASRQYFFSGKKGNFPISITASPFIKDRHPIGIVIVFRDITRERQLEQAKDEFISIASHQLRTPATAIKQFIGMVLQGYTGKITKEQNETLQAAYDSNERQIHIVQDLLTVGRLESGRIEFNKSEIDFTDLVEKSIEENKFSYEARNQTMKTDLDKARTMGDPGLLRMVVDNLITNASKYTPENDGNILVSLKKKGQKIALVVKDDGVGIPKASQKQLFKRFSRVENEFSTKVGGSGLGLYIAQKIAKLHGGKISLKSSQGKGSEFTLELKMK